MPGVNGQVVSLPALHASRSMLSFAPAARMFGWFASIATAGSFCLFCENGLVGLPMLTRVSGLNAAAGSAVDNTNNAVPRSRRDVRLTIAMLLSSGGPRELRETRRPYRGMRLTVNHDGATARRRTFDIVAAFDRAGVCCDATRGQGSVDHRGDVGHRRGDGGDVRRGRRRRRRGRS